MSLVYVVFTVAVFLVGIAIGYLHGKEMGRFEALSREIEIEKQALAEHRDAIIRAKGRLKDIV